MLRKVSAGDQQETSRSFEHHLFRKEFSSSEICFPAVQWSPYHDPVTRIKNVPATVFVG
jgi:hypothetical protein